MATKRKSKATNQDKTDDPSLCLPVHPPLSTLIALLNKHVDNFHATTPVHGHASTVRDWHFIARLVIENWPEIKAALEAREAHKALPLAV